LEGNALCARGEEKRTGAFMDGWSGLWQRVVMPRTSRGAPGGTVFHVLNRGISRMGLFDDDDNYAAFECVLTETLEIQPLRVCDDCVMPKA
jgi:hypothetical protein